jgi:ADP-dependent NAD(P)H-hydrate dehydratase / NAD(P)H-hydrate epimerase
MKALTASEMREVDRLTTERFGIAGLQLMEVAGRNVAEVFLEKYGISNPKQLGRVCVLCGKGNNGGDGFVVARYLKEEAESVAVYLFGDPKEVKGDAAKSLDRWRQEGGSVEEIRSVIDWEKAWPEIALAEVIVDALLGTGIRGAATEAMAQAITDLNRLSHNATAGKPAWIVAVDTPSGLPSDGEAAAGPVVRAHLTVTFTVPKIGQLISPDAGSCGQLVVRGIGSPESLVEEVGKGTLRWSSPSEFAGLALQRAAESHKGTYGHVLLVAGSVGKSGAAVLCGTAALRAGAGLVTLATAAEVQPIVAAAQPELMTEPLPATGSGTISEEAVRAGRFNAVLQGKTVLGIGPGIGTHPETQEFVRNVVANTTLPIVLDADGLNAFAGRGEKLAERKSKYLVVTPHPGEMARLTGLTNAEVQERRIECALEAARKWNACVVLKGFRTEIVSPKGEVFVNTTGNAGLAKGGSGDVLTGLLSALIAQFGTDELHRVVALGVYLHGLSAELLAQQSDVSGMLAGEVAHAIPYARRKLLQEVQGRG